MLMHRTVGTVLAYLNCHTYITLWWWFSLILVDLSLAVICLFIYSQWLVGWCRLLLLSLYLITKNNCTPRQKEQVAHNQAGLLMGKCFRHFAYIYTYLVSKVQGCYNFHFAHGLPITTAIVRNWKRSTKW